MALLFTFGLYVVSSQSVHISVGNKIINETDERFVSMTIDMSQIVFDEIDIKNETLIYLASQFSPSILRVGGTQSDYTYYEVGNENPCHMPSGYHCYPMSQFDELVSFSHSIGADLVFGLSMGYPTYPSDGSTAPWNSSNTESFLSYLIATQQYSANDIYGFELGNEVNQGHPYKTATIQSNAFKELDKILRSLTNNKSDFVLFGPDIHSYTLRENENDFDYLPDFAESACSVVDGLTYHCYINQNETQLLTPDGLNEQYRESLRVSNIFNNASICPKLGKNIIAGEIAEHNSGGGAITSTYYDGFWYLDALGTLASLGHSIFARQTFYEGGTSYGLVDNNLNPNADYFTALLFHDLMSSKVLSVQSDDEYFRIYAHCSKNVSMSVSMAFININNKSVNVEFDKSSTASSGEVYLFLLTPYDLSKGLHSTTMALNGMELKLDSNGKLPEMNGKKMDVTNGIIIPEQCYGFFVFSNTTLDVCKS